MLAIWNSYSKSDTARNPRTITLAPRCLAYTVMRPLKLATSTLSMPRKGFPGQADTLLGGKRGGFTRAPRDRDNNPVEHARSPFDDVGMAIGDRIKRARIYCRCVHSTFSSVILIQSVFDLARAGLFQRRQSRNPGRDSRFGFRIDVGSRRQVSPVCQQGTSIFHKILVKRRVEKNDIERFMAACQPGEGVRIDDFRIPGVQGSPGLFQFARQLFVFFHQHRTPGAAGQGFETQRPGSCKQVQATGAGNDLRQPVE